MCEEQEDEIKPLMHAIPPSRPDWVMIYLANHYAYECERYDLRVCRFDGMPHTKEERVLVERHALAMRRLINSIFKKKDCWIRDARRAEREPLGVTERRRNKAWAMMTEVDRENLSHAGLSPGEAG